MFHIRTEPKEYIPQVCRLRQGLLRVRNSQQLRRRSVDEAHAREREQRHVRSRSRLSAIATNEKAQDE